MMLGGILCSMSACLVFSFILGDGDESQASKWKDIAGALLAVLNHTISFMHTHHGGR